MQLDPVLAAHYTATHARLAAQAVVLAVVLYWGRIFAIGAGYHRYFSHRAYSTGRVFQFILALACQSTLQKSVLWWAAKHRHHHLHSDTELDVHSPRHTGFWYSHVGWIFARRHDSFDMVKVDDFARFPELMWLHRHERWPSYALAVLCYLIAGWPGLFVGFFCSTCLVFHATFCINSLAHVSGRKRYVTGDDSRNNWLLAIFTMGEGWHNNHHACQSSVRQGFFWWEYDPTFYLLKALSWTGAVRDLGARTVLHGDSYDEAYAHATELAAERGLTFIHPFDDPEVIAGQGTIGMEILRQHPDPLHAIFVPVGGGGLIAGIGAYVKYLYPQVRIIGVEPDDAPTLQRALAAGERVILPQVLPRLLDAVRLSLGSAWLFLIAAEAIAATEGLGYRIFLLRRYLAMDVILPYVVWITLLAYVTDLVLRLISRRAFPWFHAQSGGGGA